MMTFIENCSGEDVTLMIIEDSHGYKFGSFVFDDWKHRKSFTVPENHSYTLLKTVKMFWSSMEQVTTQCISIVIGHVSALVVTSTKVDSRYIWGTISTGVVALKLAVLTMRC